MTDTSSNTTSEGPIELAMIAKDGDMHKAYNYDLESSTSASFQEGELAVWTPFKSGERTPCMRPSNIDMAALRARNTAPWRPRFAYLFASIGSDVFLLASRQFNRSLYLYGEEREVQQPLTPVKSPSCEDCVNSCITELRAIITTETASAGEQVKVPVSIQTGGFDYSWKVMLLTAETQGSTTQHSFATTLEQDGNSCVRPNNLANIWLLRYSNSPAAGLSPLKTAVVVAKTSAGSEYVVATWRFARTLRQIPFLSMRKQSCTACSGAC